MLVVPLVASWVILAAAPQAVVDRGRLDQKLRRALDAVSSAKDRSDGSDRVLGELLDDARTQIEQARTQLSSERSAEVWLRQQIEVSDGKPDAGAAPAPRPKDAYGTASTLEEEPAMGPGPSLPSGREPLGEVAMRSLVNAMRGQEFRGGKMRVLAQAAPIYVFRVEQIIQILGELRAPADRLEALQLTVPNLADKENLPVLYRACGSEAERNQVQQLLGG